MLVGNRCLYESVFLQTKGPMASTSIFVRWSSQPVYMTALTVAQHPLERATLLRLVEGVFGWILRQHDPTPIVGVAGRSRQVDPNQGMPEGLGTGGA